MADTTLVTGGTGFIGKHLVARLAYESHTVRVLSRNAHLSEPPQSGIEYVRGDFLNLSEVRTALQNVATLYHLAVTTVPGWSNDHVLYDAQTNLIGSLNLMQAAAEAGVRRFIFLSSGGSIYGATPPRPVGEDEPTNPISAHGVSKLAIEKYLEIYHRKYGMDYRIIRAANPYGEGQDPNKGQGFIAYALGRIACDEEVVIWGDGSVVRDFFHVEDLVDVLSLVHADSSMQRVYNVGGGQGRSLLEIVHLAQEVTGCKANVRFQPGRLADVPYNCLDITRIRQTLDWQPRIDLPAGLQRTWAWVQRSVPATVQVDATSNWSKRQP